MRIALLARNPALYSHKRLLAAAGERGHEIEVIDTLKVYIDIAAHRPEMYFQGKKLLRHDSVIPRIGASVTFFGTAVLRQFEMMGTYPLNESVAITRSRDKLRSLQLLSRHGVGLPKTAFAHSTSRAEELIALAGGVPVVVKLLEGTQGVGVVLGETQAAAKSIIEAFSGANMHFLVQEFIKEAGGADIRCLVIGDKVVAAMKRQGEEGEFRSNLHRGGVANMVRITPEERSTAVRSARILGLNVAGVDLLRSNHGPVVIEVNSSPGLEGVEMATGKDVAGEIIKFIERKAQPGKTKTIGKG